MLVTSYLPILSLVIRSCLLSTLLEVLYGLQLPTHALLGVACAAVFWDFYTHRSTRVSVLCGGLAAPTLAAFMTRWCVSHSDATAMPWPPLLAPMCNTTRNFVMSCLSDVGLSVACSFHLCCLAFQPALALPKAPVLWTAFTVIKLWVLCDSMLLPEILSRAVLFYVTCMLVLYATPYLPHVDRVAHRLVSPHICMHFLIVHLYVAMGSVLVFSVVLSKVYFKSAPPPTPTTLACTVVVDNPTPSPSIPASSGLSSSASTMSSDTTLLEQLRRAKAQKNRSLTDPHI